MVRAPTSVTAVVPTFERPQMLERALHSIRGQERPPDHVIVVDDARGQGLAAVWNAIARSGLSAATVLANDRRPGASGARNAGAAASGSDVLAFLDDDDEWLPSYLYEALSCLDAERADVVCVDQLWSFPDGSERRGKTAPDALVPASFLIGNPGMVGSNVLVRREVFDAVGGFDESLPTHNDVDFGLRLSLHPGLRYGRVARTLMRIHQHGEPRLSTPRTRPKAEGIRRFYELHAHRMSPAERDRFRTHVRRLWGVDERGEVAE
jgi:GT2 family glycosyltransferase